MTRRSHFGAPGGPRKRGGREHVANDYDPTVISPKTTNTGAGAAPVFEIRWPAVPVFAVFQGNGFFVGLLNSERSEQNGGNKQKCRADCQHVDLQRQVHGMRSL